jgi:hypothetical protein
MRNQLLLLSGQNGKRPQSRLPVAAARSMILKTALSHLRRVKWPELHGKLARVVVVVVSWVWISLAAGGQTLVETYFPLNGGDQKLFSVLGAPLAMSVSDQGNGYFEVASTFGGSTQSLIFEDDTNDCYLADVDDLGRVSLDPPALFLDDDLLQKGGTAKTTTSLDNGLASVTISVTVANAGTVTVPAGKFANCKSVALHVKKNGSSSGVEVITSSSTTTIIAPGVGIIKTEVLPGVEAELVNGTVGGAFVGDAGLSPLTIQFGGAGEVALKGVSGSMSSRSNVKLLQIGQSYAATAKDMDGSVFDGWSDGRGNVLTTSTELTFTMQSNLVLQANFVPNPFAGAAGKYIGLFMPYESNTVQNSGFVSLTVTQKGAFSGYLQAGNTRHSFSGQFDGNGDFTKTISFPDVGSVTVGLNLSVPDGVYLNGTITSENWTAQLTANQLYGGKATYSETGLYSVGFTDSDGNSDGRAVLNFTKSGPTTMTGKLSDGAKFSASSTFSPLPDDVGWPFYAPLYGGKGCLIGWMDLGPSEVVGNFIWIQPAGPEAANVVHIQASGQPEF